MSSPATLTSPSALTDAIYQLGIQTCYTSTLQCWLAAVIQCSGAHKANCFLLNPEANKLAKIASATVAEVQIVAQPIPLSNSDYDDANPLTLCLSEGRNFVINFSQCSAMLQRLLFTADERYQVTEGQIKLLPLRIPDSGTLQRGVIGVLALYQPGVQAVTHANRELQTLNQLAITKLTLMRTLAAENQSQPQLINNAKAIPADYGLVGTSVAMQAIHLKISQALHIKQNVLITGETGTGKELVANAIYRYGNRRNETFMVQNCASIPDQLLESELFGYRKGAFTGADKDYPGLLRSAQGGIVLLDEIGDMAISLQAKLLRVLEEQQVRPLGSTKSYPINVRIIAATHQHLEQRIQQGLFRRDLYYRLAQFTIALPSLHQRGKDAVLLAARFMQAYGKANNLTIADLSQRCADMLCQQRLLGNVRELKNIVERTLIMSPDGRHICADILASELASLPYASVSQPDSYVSQAGFNQTHGSAEAQGQTPSQSLTEQLDQFEKQLLSEYLHKNQGQLQVVGQQLQLSKGSLDYRMRKFNLSAKDWRR